MSLFAVIVFALLIALAALAAYAIGMRGRAQRAGVAGVALPSSISPPLPASVPLTGDEDTEAERIGAEKARIIRSLAAESAELRAALPESTAQVDSRAAPAIDGPALGAKLADALKETARYRQLVIDIENNAPPPILSGAGEPDDLKLIVGVGPVLERMLHNLGVTTFRQIARWSERDSAEFEAKLPEFPGRIVRDQWVTQARELHQAKFGEAPSNRPPRP